MMSRRPQNIESSASKIDAAQKRARAVELRLAGHNLKTISQEMKIAPSTVIYHLVTAIRLANEEARAGVDELRSRDWAVTELLLEQWLPRAMTSVKVLLAVNRLLDRRAKYQGFDAARTSNINVAAVGVGFPMPSTAGELAAKIKQQLYEMQAINGASEPARQIEGGIDATAHRRPSV